VAELIGVIRQSSTGEDSISEIIQTDGILGWADRNGHTVIDWAIDLNTSGSVSPWDRSGFSPWLTTRRTEHQGFVAWRVDRYARKALSIHRLIEWCSTHRKSMHSTNENVDPSTPDGKRFLQMIAMVAEWELDAITERNQGTKATLRKSPRWPGGRVPYGYETMDNPDGPGLILTIDERAVEIVREIFARVIQKEPVHNVRDDLNKRGVLSPANYYRQRRGKKLRDEVWGSKTIYNLIRERTVLGQKVHDPNWRVDGSNGLTRKGAASKAVRGGDGNPLQQGPPLVPYPDWVQANKAVDDASRPQKQKHPLYLLAGVLRCKGCQYMMSAQTNDSDAKPRRYYRCSAYARGRSCDAKLIRAEAIEAAFEASFLHHFGDEDVEDLVWQEGTDYSDRLAELEETLAELAEDRRLGLYRGTDGSARYRSMYVSLEEEKDRLSTQPAQPSGYMKISTGQTYRERWTCATTEERRALLIDHHVHGEARRVGDGPGFELSIGIGSEL
jgi:DNA invertase Pin-like site-specific DNA recombinase